jgi:hypothetical protein
MNSAMNPAHEAAAAVIARATPELSVAEGRYFREAGSAVERAAAAWRAAVFLSAARSMIEQTGAVAASIVVAGDPSILLPLAAQGELRRLGVAHVSAALQCEARITRLGREGYACHGDEGRFEFESLLAAKQFAESYLRAQLQRQGGDPAGVQVRINDRYGRGKGKKNETRVFLESHITASTSCNPASPA